MISVFLTFVIALVLALMLTPVAEWLGNRLGAVDMPLARNVHTVPIPRSGGLAITLSFILALIVVSFLPTSLSNILFLNTQNYFILLGALVIFTVGFFDDFHRLRPSMKFLGQILAASLVYYSGLQIRTFVLGTMVLHFGIFSYFVTVFWFLLLINAVNLIDGLDGLAAGVSFFACMVMAFLSFVRPDYLVSLGFAAIAGALLGFLRYNFNPASIFMGDGGSYFVGYVIAALAIMGSMKSQLGATLLIPLLALGVPIFDTLLSPIRRWALGHKMFYPDKGHIHHHLLAKGLSSRRSVLIIYGISFMLCITGIIVIHIRNSMVGMFLIALIIIFFVVIRKLGYLEYLAIDKFYGWFMDLSFEAGFNKGRRSFLNIQIEIERAQNVEEIWEHICEALELMNFDRGELYLYDFADELAQLNESAREDFKGNEVNAGSENFCPKFLWVRTRDNSVSLEEVSNQGIFRIEIPLNIGKSWMGKLIMLKDLTLNSIQPYTLRRVEYLRRSIIVAVKKIAK